MKEQINALKETILFSIIYGKYKFISTEKANTWNRIEIEIEDYFIIVGIEIKKQLVILHNLEFISELLTKEQQSQIITQLENEL